MIEALGEVSRWALVAVFCASLAHKAHGPRAFARSAGQLLAVGAPLALPLAALSAIAEAALIVSLLVAGDSPLPYLLAAVVLAGYSGAIARALRRGARATCACFHGSSAVRALDLVRNGALVVLTGIGALASVSVAQAPTEAGHVVAALGGVVIGAALTQFSRVWQMVEGTETT